MITIHYLHRSRAFRVVWLMEELGLPYDLICYDRNPDRSAPASLAAVHPLGRSPVIVDGTVVLFESGAILEYLIHRYGHGALAVAPHHVDYARYLTWLHAAEATCMPALQPLLRHRFAGAAAPSAAEQEVLARVQRLADEALAQAPWFSGTTFGAADIMMHTWAVLADTPALARFVTAVQGRPAWQRAGHITEPAA